MHSEAYRLNYLYESCHWWFLARREIILDTLNKLQQKFTSQPKDATILDYGCGTGGLTQSLNQFGNVEGIDFDDEPLDYCRKRGLQNIRKINHAQEIQSNHYDLITSFDVLEHIEDDEGHLQEWHRMLKEGGVLFITVPAYQWLWSGEDVVSNHQRRYTKHNLNEKVQKNGFQIIRCTYFNSILFPFIATQRYYNRLFNPKSMTQSDVKQTSPIINLILCRMFVVEKYLLRIFNLPIGVSIMLVAQKCDGK